MTWHQRMLHRKRVRSLIVISIVLMGVISAEGIFWFGHKNTATSIVPQVAKTNAQTSKPDTKNKVPKQASTSVIDYQIPPVTNGLAPVLHTIPTKQPVVFLGIDDGANKNEKWLQMMQQNNIKVSIYLAKRFITDNPAYFLPFQSSGVGKIEDHSLTHRLLSGVAYEDQKKEICGMADYETEIYGKRPLFFRPPGGSYDINTQKAAADCGMKAVVIWHAKANGGSMQYQSGHALVAGDIVLMHFRPEFAADMQSFIDAQNAAGLHTEFLEDWL
jgi:peptidoglycan-N-acetylglucosamine deacetylase